MGTWAVTIVSKYLKIKKSFCWAGGQPFPSSSSYLQTGDPSKLTTNPPPSTMFISVKNSDRAPRHWAANGFFSDQEMFSLSHNNGVFTDTYVVGSDTIPLTSLTAHGVLPTEIMV